MIILRNTLAVLNLAFFFVSCAAFPWSSSRDNAHVTSHQHHIAEHQSHKLRGVFPQLTWLRDTAIEKVFGQPPKKDGPGQRKPAVSHAANSNLPTTLLAKYGGDVVLRFNLTTAAEEKALAEAADTLFLDVWEFTNNWADIRLREDDVASLLGLLPKSLQRAYSHLMPDLAKTIYQSYPSITFEDFEPATPSRRDAQAFSPALKTTGGADLDNIFFRDYQPYSVIVPWMRLMASMFTTHVRMLSIGTSYEGRDIPGLRVGVSPKNSQEPIGPRKTIIVSGGFHAREWISVSTVTYIAWSLITSYGKNAGITKLLQEFDFIFIPTVNVDGYVYTWENDRLWRKNRQQTNLRFCRGLDLDRSFGFEWDGTTFQNNPCSESFPGEEPFQAVESHRLAEWARNETQNNGVKFVGFLDLHSYSQQILYPYSYSCAAFPPSQENLEELALGLAKSIRISSGQQYGVSSACEGAVPFRSKASGSVSARMETGGGSAIDWFYHEMKVRYSYQIKLRDTGSYGFLLPKDNIVPTGEEAFNAVKYFGDFLLGNKGIESTLFPEIHKDENVTPPVGLANAVEEEMAGEDIETVDEWDERDWELRRRRR
ncbi:putative metallocarboxypeptidase ecm14 [Coleophoma crateriformis]|uniref:Inactive metallocarboxypeptidase ECM14 n=1 Tax=Coleophoma crateriformis TaxID=565419 RepID=A0A3D8QUB2_9HELO|nr:putative metallocarboxypeptidase ecm14 [Coleophoma crateriformis]